MLGANTLMKKVEDDGLTLLVHSVFATIQGEGPNAGRPAVFLRLGGCNLRCSWCDTDFETDVKMCSIETITARIDLARRGARMVNSFVVITGGEPLRQNLIPLLVLLTDLGHTVQIETSGSLPLNGLAELARYLPVRLVCSPKTGKIQESLVPCIIAWKYIIRANEVDPEDGLPNVIPSTGITGWVARPEGEAQVYVQPCDEHDDILNCANNEAAVASAIHFGYTLSFQMHKHLGLE